MSQFDSSLRAKVIYADAGARSDLRVESPYQLTIQTDAAVNQDAKPAGDFTPGVFVVFSIFTPAFGTTRTSNSQYARVVNEAPGVWVICFEGGSDNDFDDLIVRIWNTSCQSQTLASNENLSDPLQVFYDSRFLVEPSDPDYLAKATWMAQGIRDEAIDARDEMAATFELFGARNEIEGWPIKINLDCDPRAVLNQPVGGNGNTIGEDLIKIRASFLGPSMQPYIADRAAGNAGSALGQAWADLLHHELIHAYQSRKLGLVGIGFRYLLESDASLIEGTAQFGSDLLENGDDNSNSGESFMEMVRRVRLNPGTTQIVFDHNDGDGPYRSAPFQQYLAERFGNDALPTLEARGAEFIRRLYGGPTKYRGYEAAIGVDRDGKLTDARNLADVPKWLRILDETTQHGAAPSFGAIIPAQSWNALSEVPVNFGNEHWDQVPTTAKVEFLTLPVNTAAVKVTVVDDSPWPGRFAVGEWDVPVRLAFLPSRPAGGSRVVSLAPGYLRVGPTFRSTSPPYVINTAGMDKLQVLSVAGPNRRISDVTFEAIAGAPALSVDPVVDAVPGAHVLVTAHPTIGGNAVRELAAGDFTATIDGQPATVTAAYGSDTSAAVLLKPSSTLSAGSHTVVLTFKSGTQQASASRPFQVQAAPPNPGPRVVPLMASGSSAGMPLNVSASVADGRGPIADATVTAVVTAPGGASRTFTLADSGGPTEGGAHDGAYGDALLGTALAGTYTITINASGTSSGVPFAASSSTSVTLGPGTDLDADGVADGLEPSIGLDPANAADGASDLDGDGLSAAAEVAAGLNPLDADTDGGGETDGSEQAHARNPLVPTDDAAPPSARVAAVPLDGRLIRLEYTASGPGSLRIWRIAANGTETDLGTRAAGTGTLDDGPLAAGSYTYAVAAIAPDGTTGAPLLAGPVDARDDVTPPTGRIELSTGGSLVAQTTLPVRFLDVAGAPTQMRLATSAALLDAAAWIPFAASTTFQVPAQGGPVTVHAQLRDAAGNASSVLNDAVDLDLTAPASTPGPLPPSTLASAIWVPFAATDDDQVAFVEVHVRFRATPTAAWSAWSRENMGPSSPLALTLGSGDGDYGIATVAVDRAGNREPFPANGDLIIHRGAVQESVSDAAASTAQTAARSALGRDGLIHAVWVDGRNSATVTDIYYARRNDATGTWMANQRVDDASLAASSPAVAADAAGNVYALWVDNRRGDADVYFSKRSAATGTWSASVRVNDDAAGSTQSSPAIAVAPSGEAIAIWVDGRSRKKHVYSARLPAGGSTWSANLRVTSDQNNTKAAPDIAIDGNGVAHAVWGQQGQRWGVWFSSLSVGAGAWASPSQLGSTSQELTLPQIAADGTGRLVVAYLQAPTIVWAQDRPVGSTWSTAAVIGSSGTVGTMDVAYQPGGRAFAAWDANGQLLGRWFDPSNRVWGAIQNLTSSGTHATPSVALTASQTVVVSTDGAGTAADIKAYVLPTP